jgi:hypothetical protein
MAIAQMTEAQSNSRRSSVDVLTNFEKQKLRLAMAIVTKGTMIAVFPMVYTVSGNDEIKTVTDTIGDSDITYSISKSGGAKQYLHRLENNSPVWIDLVGLLYNKSCYPNGLVKAIEATYNNGNVTPFTTDELAMINRTNTDGTQRTSLTTTSEVKYVWLEMEASRNDNDIKFSLLPKKADGNTQNKNDANSTVSKTAGKTPNGSKSIDGFSDEDVDGMTVKDYMDLVKA